MTTQALTAAAAVAAALISLVNIAFTALSARRQEEVRWRRNLLPELIDSFSDATFQDQRVIYETDWATLGDEEQLKLGDPEYRKASALLNKLEAFAKPETIVAARNLLYSIQDIRMASFDAIRDGTFTVQHPVRNLRYWAYVEARYMFIAAARREMGLAPPPIPPSLADFRKSMIDPTEITITSTKNILNRI